MHTGGVILGAALALLRVEREAYRSVDSEYVLALYDKEERREVEQSGMRRGVTPFVVRQVDLLGRRSTIVYSRLEAAQADSVIGGEVAYFDGLGHDLEWKLYAHDTPANLHDYLVAQHFEAEDPEAIMVLDLASVPGAMHQSPQHDVRRIADSAGLQEVLAVSQEVWEEDFSELGARLALELHAEPCELAVYVAYVDDVPACCGWLRHDPRSQFASLWGGSTRPGYRGRGLYTALLTARAEEAQRRGARFLTVDAGAMSRPIVAALGFVQLTTARAYMRHAARG